MAYKDPLFSPTLGDVVVFEHATDFGRQLLSGLVSDDNPAFSFITVALHDQYRSALGIVSVDVQRDEPSLVLA